LLCSASSAAANSVEAVAALQRYAACAAAAGTATGSSSTGWTHTSVVLQLMSMVLMLTAAPLLCGERGVLHAPLCAAMRSRAPLSAVCVLPPVAVSSRPCLVLSLPWCPNLSSTTSSMRLLFTREDVKDIKVVVNYDM
jgi:hypothetical protein